MRGIAPFALMVSLLLVSACASGAAEVGVTPAAPDATSTLEANLEVATPLSPPAPTPIAAAATSPPSGKLVPAFEFASIEVLAPGLEAVIAASDAPLAVAVLVPAEGRIYVGGDDRPFALASAAKIPILLAVLQRAESEGRALSAEERVLLGGMIRFSDNRAASAFWTALGRAEGVEQQLSSLGVFEVEWPEGSSWGDMAMTAPEFARLMWPLLEADPDGGGGYGLALALLQDVALDQRWGVSAGLNTEHESVTLGLKEGWFPETTGWRVASAGIVTTIDAGGYALVVLTDEQPSLAEGAWDIERVSAAVHAALLPTPLTADLVLTQFPESGATPAPLAANAPNATETTEATEATAEEPESDATPEEETAPATFLPLAESPSVLVPAAGVLVSQYRDTATSTRWYEVPDIARGSLLAEYRASMEALGWTAQDARTDLLLSGDTGFVLAAAHDGGDGDTLMSIVVGPTAASVLAASGP